MKIFLSSENLGKYPEVFVGLMGKGKRLAVIENAKDDWSGRDRKAKLKEHIEQFESLNLIPEEVDLRHFFNEPEKLLNLLSNFDGIWASGGNTFILRRAMVLSGLDTVLKQKVPAGELVYGGSSAGSIVATPSLHGTEFGDDPRMIPDGYIKEIIWEGLNLVDFYIVPHYQSKWFGKEAQAMKSYFEEQDLPHYALRDGQVIVVEDGKHKILK